MTGPFFLGNDVVDLAELRARDRSPDRIRRLEARILSPVEQEALAAVPEIQRHSHFWCMWAAKETAFKVHTKLLGYRPVFRHAHYQVTLDPPAGADELGRVSGVVDFGDAQVTVGGWRSESFVHLAGYGPSPQAENGRHGAGGSDEGGAPLLELGLEQVRSRVEDEDRTFRSLEGDFSAREWASIHSAASARARILARHRLASWVGAEVGDVEILTDPRAAGRSPPWIRVRGRRIPHVDVSLSHHGACIAWALLLPAASNAAGPVRDGDYLSGR